jgi:hypothetical protein
VVHLSTKALSYTSFSMITFKNPRASAVSVPGRICSQ